MDYAKTITVDLPYEQAVARVREAFEAQGFGILTEIDVRATLEAKLGADMEPYLILGACNPELAQRALDVSRDVGLLLPCTVVVRENVDGVVVQALDAGVIAAVPDIAELGPIATEADHRIQAALDDLEAG